MNTALKIFTSVLLLLCAAGSGLAQQTAPAPTPAPAAAAAKSTAQIDAGEPRANSVPPAARAPAVETPANPPAAATAPSAPTVGRTTAKAPAAARVAAAAAADRLNLNTATVTGDREQPKVMYIVPWKSSNIGDLSGKPMNSLLDEVLAPVDREEFKREVAYYDAVKADMPQNGAPAPAKQGEK